MAAMVARGSQLSSSISVQENGSRNKRKFRADPPLVSFSDCDSTAKGNGICDPYKFSLSQIESPNFEFPPERTQTGSNPEPEQHGFCDLCSFNQEQLDLFKSNVQSSVVGNNGGSPDLGYGEFLRSSQPREGLGAEVFQDADWNDLTESQLEELVLSNLDVIFRSAIKKIASCGYTEEAAMKAVLRSGLCYGCKDTVSNIVDNTLAYLRNGQAMDSKDQFFEDLQHLEKYILAEMVCVLKEVRPFFSTGDAMWCLLICDMNVSHACAMDVDPSSNFGNSEMGENPSISLNLNDLKSHETNCPDATNLPEPNIPKLNKSNSGFLPCPQNSKSEPPATPTVIGIPNLPVGWFSLSGNKGKPPLAPEGKLQETSNPCCSSPTAVNPKCGTANNAGNLASSLKNHLEEAKHLSQSLGVEEKSAPESNQPEASKGIHISATKKESLLRQKSGQLEKFYRSNGVKGSSRTSRGNGLGGFVLDKKCKVLSDSTSSMLKNASNFQLNRPISFEASSLADGLCRNTNFSTNPTSPVNSGINPKIIDVSSSPPVANTELSLSLTSENKVELVPNCDVSIGGEEASNFSYVGCTSDKIFGYCCPDDTKDEMLLKLVSRARELQSQLQEWTEWAQQKVMQAARRLGKDKLELKTLRQEKEEVARLKKEKQTLEENTMKKLSEMEYALGKASGQVERANAAVRGLEAENAELRQEMEAAKARAAESAASCQEVSRSEKKTLKKFQSWDRQKALFQEELAIEKRKLSQLQQQLEKDKEFQAQLEVQWRQEEKAKNDAFTQVISERKEREQIETTAKSKEDMIRLKAENDFQKYRDDIMRLEKEITQLRLKTDSSKIVALRWGIDSSYASCLTDARSMQVLKENNARLISEIADFQDSQVGDVQRERECVMCLSEEMSVIFLPCAHQVVCTKCNELHEKQGMKDCPSCRTPVNRRICVRSAHS